MTDEHTGSDPSAETRDETVQEFGACCASMMGDHMKSCPCGEMARRHRVAIFGFVSLIALLILVSQVGGILGIIAFARTF